MLEASMSLLIPFIGTTLGASMVFFLKNKLNEKLEKLLLGFASGVMVAASVFSLLLPSFEMGAEALPDFSWVPALTGFLIGIFFLLALDSLIPHIHPGTMEEEGRRSSLKSETKMFLAISLHNAPEGMAVGVSIALFLSGNGTVALPSIALAIGMAIQNFPEGLLVSFPFRNEGKPRWKAFLYGAISGLIEPICALLMIALGAYLTPTLPYLLAFAAGSMLYVVVEELIPEAQKGQHSNLCVLGFAIGFALMMVLDSVL